MSKAPSLSGVPSTVVCNGPLRNNGGPIVTVNRLCVLSVAPGKGRAKGLLAMRTYSVIEAKRFYAPPTEDRDGEHVFLVRLLKERKGWVERAR